MKPFLAVGPGSSPARRHGARGSTRTLLLVVVCLLAGLMPVAFLVYRATRSAPPEAVGAAESGLSEGTLAVLQRLDFPVELRFYSLLDPASTSQDLRAFAGRVDRLLSAYEHTADGKIKVVRHTTLSPTEADAASADGLQPFNLSQGEACFLGIVAARGSQKEILARLSPEWEAALESDLSRAIERLASAKPATKNVVAAAAAPPRLDPAVVAAVKRVLPNVAAVSLEDGSRMLREAALTEFQAAMKDMDRQIQEARQRVVTAKASGNEAEQAAALKNLQDLQASQAEKLQQIAARTQAQVEAFEQIKKDAR